ncbi:uncharacterized protein MELLADRAFT_89000 [Melampsora larici-populina 98AG31]|uniref:Uncharacterized protein n=1 Tax=Melampsora larici-populina (strain 98AG31 / pathotype 3-4-7) TaxID=747676 RepID=F4R6L3_MELLP|nr:uncharacterized protein MELLADRAFT_89000 [Melampsora larici-populina 98AG31]EGG12444.1 hypothetical protein MELLADRAFT_89000 [Melampsora larici-populina 98AG31]
MSQGPTSIEIADSVPFGETKIQRSHKSIIQPDIIKVHKEVKRVTKVIGGKEVTEDKVWEFYELRDYKYWTFKQFLEEVNTSLTYSSTKPALPIMANASGRLAITFATTYDLFGVEGLEHSINETDLLGLFTNSNLLTTLVSVIDKTPSLKFVVHDGESKCKSMSKIQELRLHIRVVSRVLLYDELREVGTESNHPTVKADPEDIACIMYKVEVQKHAGDEHKGSEDDKQFDECGEGLRNEYVATGSREYVWSLMEILGFFFLWIHTHGPKGINNDCRG